jgi:hypothetical protein
MMIVLRTQYRENYGTPEAPYWKNKGGSEYKITNVPTSLSEQEMLEVVDKIMLQSFHHLFPFLVRTIPPGLVGGGRRLSELV